MTAPAPRSPAPAGGAAPAVFVLGAGRAGLALAAALAAAGVPLAGLHARRGRPPVGGLPAVSAGALPPRTLGAADVVLVTVRDAQLDGALAELAAASHAGALPAGAVVLHASGGTEPRGLAALRAAGHAAGTFHPLLPLAGADAAGRLRGAWIGVDGDDRARTAARTLAGWLGARALDVPAGEKARYHAAAVLASNFPAVLAALAARLLRAAGVAPAQADGAARTLLRGAVANLGDRPLDAASVAAVLTGPAARADVDTIRGHVDALREDADLAAVYDALTRAAVTVMADGGALDAAARDRVRSALGQASGRP